MRLGAARQRLARPKLHVGWTAAGTRKAALAGAWIVANVIGIEMARQAPAALVEPSLRHLLEMMAVLKAGMAAGAAVLVHWRLSRSMPLALCILYSLSVALMALATQLIWHLSYLPAAAILFHGGLLLLLALAYYDRDDVGSLGGTAAARWMDMRRDRR